MILYEFVCSQCGHEFEELQTASGEAVQCPKCRSGQVKRLLSAVRCARSSGSPGPAEAACAPGGGFS
jgi:putative FmdB family regulatory protein